MDGESDGDEFYDASEYPTISTPEKDDNVGTRSGDGPDRSPIIGGDLESSVGKDVPKDETDGSINQSAGVDKKSAEALQATCLANEHESPNDAKLERDNNKSDIKENEKKTTEINTTENNQGKVKEVDQNNSDKTNSATQAPIAPPRRKKKNKKQPNMTQKSASNENFKSYINSEETEQVDTTQSKDEKAEQTLSSVDDKNVASIKNIEETVDSDLDISTQEMSEILDRNSCTEVISPLHLQRNKSQSISSIGSFCSVSSNVSFQEKSKRSGSLGSLNNTEKTPTAAPVVVDPQLTDQEILEAVVVRNLDTGETMPLSEAEKNLPSGVNPLALHIMRLTTEFSSKQDLAGSDREDAGDVITRKILRKKKNLRGLFVRKVKNKDQKMKGAKEGGKRADESSSSDEDNPQSENYIKVKSANGKGNPILNKLNIIQDLSGKHQGAVWTMKFSSCGKLLGTAGQDKIVHVWVLKTEKAFFEQMQKNYSKAERPATPESEKTATEENEKETKDKDVVTETDYPEGFCKEPFSTYEGHTGDVLDLSWSKNYFLLSSSMDKTVRLWHISRTECLCCFQHIDFVTAITFHPRDDRYFLSGSLDGKIRLWNIPDKKVALWNELEGAGSHLITAANFCMNGKFAVIGTYDGRCIFYETEHLKYYTQWQIRSTRKKQGRKISGIEPMPGEDKILITSNDSRIRLYSLKDHSLHCKYKGFTNSSSQIKGSFSHDGELVISGSEDHYVYMWRAQHRIASARKDKNDFYESFSAHNAVVTAAIFAPCPWNVVPTEYDDNSAGRTGPEVVVAADYTGSIKIFINRYANEKT